MSKKKHKAAPARTKTSARRNAKYYDGLQQAQWLIQRKRALEALTLLQEMQKSYPHDEELLARLVNVCINLKDSTSYQHYAEQLLPMRPEDPNLLLGLASAYMSNLYPALAAQTFRRFLELHPDYPKAGEVRQSLAEIEAVLDAQLPGLGLTGPDRLELAVLHERMNVVLSTREFAQGRKIGQQLLSRQPTFIPAHNNLSIMEFGEGKSQQAIERARYVLTLEPDNYQALGNLTRYLTLTGQSDEAQRTLQRLLAIDGEDLELFMKQVETLAYVGEDQALLEVYQRAAARGYHNPPLTNPGLHHLTAVAALRLGQEKQARDLWRQALKLRPGLGVARDNLADLQQPVEKRHAPWSFSLQQWVPPPVLESVRKQWPRAAGSRRKDASREAVLRILKQHPELVALTGILLDRGDPTGRTFALDLALSARTPEMLQALRDFALGQRGPDELRIRAAQELSRDGLLPEGPVRTWVKGRWQELSHYQFEID